jgi:hypothetical protein
MAANWKTTTAGILVLLIAVAQAVIPWLQSGTPIQWAAIGTALAAGIGLLFAADHNVPTAPGNGK